MIGFIFVAVAVVGYFLILNSKVKNKGAALLEKTITAILSAFIFSLCLAFLSHTPVEEQQAGVGYISFMSLFIIYFMYSLLVFLICGGLYSFFADIYLDNIHFRTVFLKYITGILTYLLGGFLIVGLFFVIMVLINKGINDLFVSGIFSV